MNLQFLARGPNPRFRASAKPRAAQFELPVRDGERAVEVFHHPYAYAAQPQHRRVPIAASHSS
ncbi:MAG: hypothetical protein WBP81_01440 [Solirubrobacteraceae bacterium]